MFAYGGDQCQKLMHTVDGNENILVFQMLELIIG